MAREYPGQRMTTTQATNWIGQILTNNGCYTNFGMVQHTTNRINQISLINRIVDETAVTAVIDSANSKVGVMNATYAPQLTCPTSCPFYPEIFGDVNDIETRMHIQIQFAEIEAAKIDELPADRKLRVHVVGDSSNTIAAGIIGDAMVRYESRSPNHSQAFTYTHAWNEPVPVPESAWNGARVLASCESAEQISSARELGYACEWTYEKHISRKVHERDGVKILPCPNNFNKDITCAKCMKCADLDLLKTRNWAIGLATHGAHRKANASIAHSIA
jgi:hypothetical protein